MSHHPYTHLSALQANASTATHKVSLRGTSSSFTDSDSMRVFMCSHSGVWASRVVFLLWSFTVQRWREGGILVIAWVSGEFVWAQEHGACEWVRGGGYRITGVCHEKCWCKEREREGKKERARERPGYLRHSLTNICLMISLPLACINTPVKVQPGRKLISYYLIILLGFAWSVS